jgi:hypothetical protein
MAKLKEGDSLAQLSAREFNRHVDASDAWHRSQALGRPRHPSSEAPVPTDVVKVKLTADMPRGSAVGIGTPSLTDLDPNYLWFDYAAPDAAEPFGILRGATTEETFGEAQVSGVCIARVDVLDTDHRFARVAASGNVLESAGSGPVQLLRPATETGEQELVVLLGTQESILTGVLTGTLLQGSSAGVDEIDLDTTNALIYTGRSFTVWDLKLNAGESIDAGVKIDFAPMSGGRYKWIAAHCAVSNTLPEEE